MKPEQIKANLNRRVRCRSAKTGIDADYILTGAIFRSGKQGFFYQAELQDQRQSKSILICSLDEVEPAAE